MHITSGGILFLLVIFLTIVGLIIFRNWRKTGNFSFKPGKFINYKKSADKPHNTVVIDRIRGWYSEYNDPDEMKEMIPQICRNNNRAYYVIRKDGKESEAYYPNDTTKYYHPKEWAMVLMMKANEELFKKRNNLFKNVHVWALVAAMAILFILIIIL